MRKSDSNLAPRLICNTEDAVITISLGDAYVVTVNSYEGYIAIGQVCDGFIAWATEPSKANAKAATNLLRLTMRLANTRGATRFDKTHPSESNE